MLSYSDGRAPKFAPSAAAAQASKKSAALGEALPSTVTGVSWCLIDSYNHRVQVLDRASTCTSSPLLPPHGICLSPSPEISFCHTLFASAFATLCFCMPSRRAINTGGPHCNQVFARAFAISQEGDTFAGAERRGEGSCVARLWSAACSRARVTSGTRFCGGK